MAFPRRFLNEGEEVILDLRPHWRSITLPAIALAAAAALLVWLSAKGWADALQLVAAVVVLVALGWFVARYLRWATTSLVVTSQRVVHRSGVLARQGVELPLEQVARVSYRQALGQRLVGAGDLLIEPAGGRGSQHVADLPRVADLHQEVSRRAAARRDRLRGSAARLPGRGRDANETDEATDQG